MKRNILLLLILFVTSNLYSQNPIYWFAFSPPLIFDLEDRDINNNFYIDSLQSNNIWQLSIPNKPEFNSAYSGNLALITDSINFYPINNKSSFIFQLYSDDHTELSFNHKFDFDEGMDGGIIELSFDNGDNWINIPDAIEYNYEIDSLYKTQISSYNNKVGFSGSSNGWKNARFYFRYGQSGTLFKFTLSSDELNNDREGWLIDDIQFWIIGTPVNEIGKKNVKVFPNPFNESIKIEFESNSRYNLSITDLKGNIVQEIDNVHSDNFLLNTANLIEGIYILSIESDKGIAHFKLIK